MSLGHVAKTIIIEEISRVSGAMGAMVQASQLGVAKILRFGNESQKRRWLPAIARGECLPTIAVTEGESGGHVLGMAASAKRDGGGYIPNGNKMYLATAMSAICAAWLSEPEAVRRVCSRSWWNRVVPASRSSSQASDGPARLWRACLGNLPGTS
jgi:alkylation response protein AidB-like acyl-CoA dehydrogenase